MPSLKKQTGKTYWRSLDELAQTPEFQKNLQNEFPQSAIGLPGSFSRRRFMQLMSASVALATGSSCRWEKDNLVPFTRRPAGHIPGVPQHYATSFELGGHAMGLLVTSYDGRPIKIEGNPEHPLNRGGTSAFAQASILELYDPDRSDGLVSATGLNKSSRTWAEFNELAASLRNQAQANAGEGLRILSLPTSSPTEQRLKARLLAEYPKAKWVTFEPWHRSNEAAGLRLAFGQAYRSRLNLSKARVVLALDDDFLVEHPAATAYARDFAQARLPGEHMLRLYAVESRHSTTGAMADHRLPLRSGDVGAFVLALASKLASSLSLSIPANVQNTWQQAASDLLKQPKAKQLIDAVAKDLLKHRQFTAITVGAGQSKELHALVHRLNVALQNANVGVLYTAEPASYDHVDMQALTELVGDMREGKVATLVMLGGNPVFNTPAALQFAAGLRRVKTSIHVSLYRDETSLASTWHLPAAHYLESWGDVLSYDGTYSLVQPLIAPLYDGRSHAEILALLLGDEHVRCQDLVKQTFALLFTKSMAAVDADKTWHDTVRQGFVAHSSFSTVVPTHAVDQELLQTFADIDVAKFAGATKNKALELTFWPDSHVYDGRFANNGWLQELPDFMTKLTWDNAVMIAPQTAKELGIKHETLVSLQVGDKQLNVAAYVMPGQAPGTLALSLGYGRSEAGHVGGTQAGDVEIAGFNTYLLWHGGSANFVTGATVTPQNKSYELAITQDHHSYDDLAKAERDGRVGEIVREASLERFIEEPNFAQEMVEHPPLKSLWTSFGYDNVHRWGMAIDLNKCVGCNACVIACQAENNIPIVGKEQVIKGREMHWLRIDRYFSGDENTPEVATQPMLCQQCEMAPCEQVCPVAATVHSSEGLNDMVYNRCIGTRYCSNNCPYKVRRFNFFNYHKNLVDPQNQVAKMVYNPEATVRARGVMEKCNYCVQRIRNKTIVARNHKRVLADLEIVTACAQACPAEAIVFGDLNDPHSRVAAQHQDQRAYAVLEQLNTKPRTLYLAKITNTNPDLVESAS